MGDRTEDSLNPALALEMGLAGLAPEGVLIAHRMIVDGDENALVAVERGAVARSVPKVQRQSGAVRMVARDLLASLGHCAAAIPKSATGAPVWPPGIVGSLAHDEHVAIAVVARANQFSGLGVDVEPAAPLPPELITLVATPRECRRYSAAVTSSRLLFSIKEAVYKAQHPRDGLFLDFHDIEVDLDAHRAITRHGRTVVIKFIMSPRIVALCFD